VRESSLDAAAQAIGATAPERVRKAFCREAEVNWQLKDDSASVNGAGRNKAHCGGGSNDEFDSGTGGELVVEVTDKSLQAIEAQRSRRSSVYPTRTFNCNAEAKVHHGVDECTLSGVGGACGVITSPDSRNRTGHRPFAAPKLPETTQMRPFRRGLDTRPRAM
jgi:hypothetical protein